MRFDRIIQSGFKKNVIIEYGIIKRNNTILFIKSGQDGSIYGYHNKYLSIATNINKQFGYTVICSSNPFDGDHPLDEPMNIINRYVEESKFSDYVIYYMGHSKGALIGVWYGVQYPNIKRMLSVNGPLMFSLHKTKKGICNFSEEKIIFVYGDLDPSIKLIGLLKPLLSDKVELEIIKGQDHHFSKVVYDFKNLPEDFLL